MKKYFVGEYFLLLINRSDWLLELYSIYQTEKIWPCFENIGVYFKTLTLNQASYRISLTSKCFWWMFLRLLSKFKAANKDVFYLNIFTALDNLLTIQYTSIHYTYISYEVWKRINCCSGEHSLLSFILGNKTKIFYWFCESIILIWLSFIVDFFKRNIYIFKIAAYV